MSSTEQSCPRRVSATESVQTQEGSTDVHFGNSVRRNAWCSGSPKEGVSSFSPRAAALRGAALHVEKVDTRLSDRSAFSREDPDA